MMTEIQSGSKGNSSFLLLDGENLVLFDLGISFKKLSEGLLDGFVDIKNLEYNVIVCITHQHKDHWNTTTYKQLEKLPNLKLTLHFPQDETYILWEGYTISSKPFRHGTITSNFFVVDRTYGYLTDVSNDQLIDILLWKYAYNLQWLFVESNYDNEYLKYTNQASISNGYDVSSGFDRHLSIQEAEWLVENLKPTNTHYIHKSSRFSDGGEILA